MQLWLIIVLAVLEQKLGHGIHASMFLHHDTSDGSFRATFVVYMNTVHAKGAGGPIHSDTSVGQKVLLFSVKLIQAGAMCTL